MDDDFELSHENFLDVEMHNADGFVIDDRPDLEYSEWRNDPCMENCKAQVEITMRAVFLVETPDEGGSNSVMNEGTLDDDLPVFKAGQDDANLSDSQTRTASSVENLSE